MQKTSLLFIFFIGQNITGYMDHNFVDIRSVNPNIRIDLRYGTSKNFSGKALYFYPCALVCKEVAIALDAVQKELETYGCGLLIWDAYRAEREQRILRQEACKLGGEAMVQVSDPSVSPGYKNRGFQVELTLVGMDGNLLEMPTDFDELTEKARSDFMELPQNIIDNRSLLHMVMKKHGFRNWKPEWWYFWLDVEDWKTKFPCVELTLEQINALSLGVNP